MTFLKKLGTILAKAGLIAASLAGLAAPLLGSGKASQIVASVSNDLTLIEQQVVTIETALQGKPGAEKLAALLPLVKNIIVTSETVLGKKVANEALFEQAVQEIAQGAVDLLNSLHPDEAKAV